MLGRLRELKAHGREGAHWGEVDAEWLQLQKWLAVQDYDHGQGDHRIFPTKAISSEVPVTAALWLMLSGLGILFSRTLVRKKPAL